MFGFMIADIPALSEAQKKRYRACYCGVCRMIGRRCGQLCRCCLTYDMAFLALLLNSLYEPEEQTEERPCPVHPVGRRQSWASDASAYAADLNVLLARLDCLDDWQDEGRLLKLGAARLLEKPAAAVAERNPRQWAAIQAHMAALGEIEGRRDPSPDPGANAFGALLGELFVWREDRWSPLLRSLGLSMGRFIYLLDALNDREKDRRKGLYNPVAAMMAEGATEEDLRSILLQLMAECAGTWEKLPLVRDADIQRSILYAGVWTRLPVLEGKKS